MSPAESERASASGPPGSRGSLCLVCVHAQRVANDRGSIFLLCKLSKSDPRYRKYPPQPVVSCPGFTR